MLIKLNAPAPRGINVMVDGKPTTVVLNPGDAPIDVTLVDPKDRVFHGLVSTREILVIAAEQAAAAVQKAVEDQPAPAHADQPQAAPAAPPAPAAPSAPAAPEPKPEAAPAPAKK